MYLKYDPEHLQGKLYSQRQLLRSHNVAASQKNKPKRDRSGETRCKAASMLSRLSKPL